jgi:CheY-like chemotaxis protein
MAEIMIVDDEPDIIFVVSKMLEREGYSIVGVNSGEECLEKLGELRPDLILMDIMMPGMDGWEAARRIKADPTTKDIPIVMLTVKGEKEDKLRSFHQSKCDGYLVKPVDRDELVKVVKWLIGK